MVISFFILLTKIIKLSNLAKICNTEGLKISTMSDLPKLSIKVPKFFFPTLK